MEATELRIGNYVKVSTPAITCDNFRVDAIRRFDGEYIIRFYPMDDNDFYFVGLLRDAEPIPLTPELLERCGFKRDADSECIGYENIVFIWRSNEMELAEKNGRFYIYEPCEDPWYSSCGTEIVSVHQLQNVYYVLSGEELTVKWN